MNINSNGVLDHERPYAAVATVSPVGTDRKPPCQENARWCQSDVRFRDLRRQNCPFCNVCGTRLWQTGGPSVVLMPKIVAVEDSFRPRRW
jgi:hypothetical protein